MAPSADDEEALFDAAQYRARTGRDLLDELADVEVQDEMSGSHAPIDPWLAAGLEETAIPIWQAVMHEIVPNEVFNEERVGPDDPLYLDATPPQEEYARAAAKWHQSGFSPEEAKDWTHAIDIHERWRIGPDLADQWRCRGFTPAETRRWVQGDVSPADDPEHSKIFRDADWHPFLVWTLHCFLERESEAWDNRGEWARLPVTHALNCARAGLTPREAEALLHMDEQELETHLTGRFEERGPIDPFIAMLFNHHQWQANGCEDDDSSWPFYARRLWDLHDEDDDKARRQGQRAPYGGPYAKKPRWKISEERADQAKAEAKRPKPVQCGNSGGLGDLEFRDGMEEWYVHCPDCGVMWMGGNGDPLPVHNRPVGR